MKKAILLLSAVVFIMGGCMSAEKKPTADEVPVPFSEIEGQYRNSAEVDCELLLNITKSPQGYVYKFRVKDQLYEGNVGFTVADENYVILEGIPWEQNIGQLGEDDDPEEMKGDPTYGIETIWTGDELVFQNYGNAMNYYVKINCDEKYITLIRDAANSSR
ncbi:MAG: hypothetical protein LBV07_06795 [Syntrophobacterales bacterium]|jgi:hypothetical protein|nr:hypothetical protein [Syntrophobacterales bacterium]